MCKNLKFKYGDKVKKSFGRKGTVVDVGAMGFYYVLWNDTKKQGGCYDFDLELDREEMNKIEPSS